MSKYQRSKLDWKDNILYAGNRKTGFKLIPHLVGDKEFWKIQFPDKQLSTDFYNQTRAADNAIAYLRGEYANRTRSLALAVDRGEV